MNLKIYKPEFKIDESIDGIKYKKIIDRIRYISDELFKQNNNLGNVIVTKLNDNKIALQFRVEKEKTYGYELVYSLKDFNQTSGVDFISKVLKSLKK